MFGFPNETLEEWEEDIERLLALDVEHISAYSLMYEEGTPLYRLLQAGKVKDMNDELYRPDVRQTHRPLIRSRL